MNDKFVFSIGVGVFVRNGGTLLVGRRGPKCSRGAGLLALPGGVIEPGETVAQAVVREVREETGLTVQLDGKYPMPPGDDPGLYQGLPFAVPGLLAVTDHSDIGQQQDGLLLPHLSLWVMTHYVGGHAEVKEPDKCEYWGWVTLPHLVRDLGAAATNPTNPQYYWTPVPLWRKILRPYYGNF